MHAEVLNSDAARAIADDLITCLRHDTYRVSPVLPNPRNKVMTLRRLHAGIEAGWGQGRDERYQPWIRVRRKLSSPVSNLYVLHIPLYAERSVHLLSMLERIAAQVALWLGATEVREQHPMWPDEHANPAQGGEDEPSIQSIVPGLLDIAKDAGIRHGVYPGTGIPFIATTDLLLSVPAIGGGSRPVMWPCKPDELQVAPRAAERLALEHLYAKAAGAFCKVFSTSLIPKLLPQHLDWFMPRNLTIQAFGTTSMLIDFAAAFMEVARERSISASRLYAATQVGISQTEMQHLFFRLSCWQGLIPIDFSEPIIMSRLLKIDRGLKENLRSELFGAAHGK